MTRAPQEGHGRMRGGGEVLWTLALHFNMTKTRFVDVAALLSGVEEPVVPPRAGSIVDLNL